MPPSTTTPDVRNSPSKFACPPERSKWAVNSNGPWLRDPEKFTTMAPCAFPVRLAFNALHGELGHRRPVLDDDAGLVQLRLQHAQPAVVGFGAHEAFNSGSEQTRSASSSEPSSRRSTRRVALVNDEVRRLELAAKKLSRLTSICTLSAFSHGSTTARGAPISSLPARFLHPGRHGDGRVYRPTACPFQRRHDMNHANRSVRPARSRPREGGYDQHTGRNHEAKPAESSAFHGNPSRGLAMTRHVPGRHGRRQTLCRRAEAPKVDENEP